MAEDITVPGMGKTKKQYIYLGGGALAAILIYAYWKRAHAAPTTATMDVNSAVGAGYATTGVANQPGATSTSTVTSGTLAGHAIQTNGDWTQAVVSWLGSNGGANPSTVAAALGLYLNRDPKGLTAEQRGYVMSGIAAFGVPPVGGPYPIIDAMPDGSAAPVNPPGIGLGGYPTTGVPNAPPPPNTNPHIYITHAGDTIWTIPHIIYSGDPDMVPGHNDARLKGVADALYRINAANVPSDYHVALPAGIALTYY